MLEVNVIPYELDRLQAFTLTPLAVPNRVLLSVLIRFLVDQMMNLNLVG